MGDSENTTDKSNRPLLRQCFVTANVSLTFLGNGCAIAVAAILIPGLRAKESHIHATVNEESWIAATLGLSLSFGNIFVTAVLDKLGRRKCHFLSIIPLIMSWFILILSNTVAQLITARFIQGFSIGIYAYLGIIIIGEMTEPKHRGIFLSMISLSLTIGVLFNHTLGSFFSWQISALICTFVHFTSLVMLFYTPESPFWLISKGRFQEASDVFFWLRGNGEIHKIEFEKMVTAQKSARKSSVAGQELPLKMRTMRYFKYLNETCKKPEFYKPIIIMCFLYTMYQFAGVNVVNCYATDIIEEVVGPESNSSLLMVIFDAERLVCNILSVYLIKIMKRRTLLFSTGFGCVLSYFGMAAYVYMKQTNRIAYDSQWIPIALIVFYMLTLTVGISSVPFAIAGEIFPLKYRGLGSGISMLVLSITFFLAVKLFPILISAVGISMTYILYSSIVIVGLGVAWLLLPETKDRTLQDIEDIFKGYSTEDVKSSKPLNENEEEIKQSSHSIHAI